MGVLAVYLLLSISVYINAHLKGEFKLTYAGMGPTEFRLIMVLVNTLFIYVALLRDYVFKVRILGNDVTFGSFDFIGMAILLILVVIHFYNFIKDARGYALMDPLKKWDGRVK